MQIGCYDVWENGVLRKPRMFTQYCGILKSVNAHRRPLRETVRKHLSILKLFGALDKQTQIQIIGSRIISHWSTLQFVL